MKTYILKKSVHNYIDFPIGTIVIITDDYYVNGVNDSNTGFTVIKGKLKGRRGCVANSLDGWLLEDTSENRKIYKDFITKNKKLNNAIKRLNKKWNDLSTATI